MRVRNCKSIAILTVSFLSLILALDAQADGPTLSGDSPTNGPVGTSVTITGTGFGATQGSSTVSFGTYTATPTSWSDTQIVAPVPSGMPNGLVYLSATVNGLSSLGTVPFAVSNSPTITKLVERAEQRRKKTKAA